MDPIVSKLIKDELEKQKRREDWAQEAAKKADDEAEEHRVAILAARARIGILEKALDEGGA